ncbi:MAG: tripartite tricarboxylate transporter substrate binding protein [Betaproteobacteria bacterium]|nr:tripartite tricarboxylate transporter substrate binding protein [Betaproteobacteria bacterium]
MRAAMKLGVGLMAVLWSLGAPAQKTAADLKYPTRPIRFICPYVAGGAGDIFTRTIGQKLTEALGQTVVVDNRPGANGGIGTDIVAKSAPDGYTLVMGNSGPLAVNPVLYKKVPYDPIKDFAPVTQGTSYMYVLVVPPSLPVRTLDDFVVVLRTKPGQMTYGSTGIGGGNHLSGELFNLMTGTQAIHVPYTGSAASLAALLGGQLNYMFDTVITSVPQLRAGKLRALGVTARKRSSALPEVPTLDELGLKGFELTQWQAVVAPGGTPKAIVDLLYREVAKALRAPDVIERLATQGGNELVGNTPEEFAQVIKNDLAKYAKLVKAAKIQVQ